MREYLEYTARGRQNVKKAAIFISAAVISSVLLGVASVGGSLFSPYFKLASGAFLLLSILVFVRFVGTSYTYKLILYRSGEGDLVVSELRGFFGKYESVKLNRTVCRVSLSDITELSTVTDKKDEKRIRRTARKEKARVYNYTADILPRELAIVRIEDGDGISYVRFSPDEELLRLLRNCISQ